MKTTLMPFTFVYTDRTKKVKKFNSPREAAEFAHNEGDHLVAWSAGGWKDKNEAVVSGVRVVCNPRGYPGENADWSPMTIKFGED